MKAMLFERPEYIPVRLSLLPAAWMQYRDDLEALVRRHPVLFPDYKPGSRDYDAVGGNYIAGHHVDEWGCVWHNVHTGMAAIVKERNILPLAELGPGAQNTCIVTMANLLVNSQEFKSSSGSSGD